MLQYHISGIFYQLLESNQKDVIMQYWTQSGFVEFASDYQMEFLPRFFFLQITEASARGLRSDPSLV